MEGEERQHTILKSDRPLKQPNRFIRHRHSGPPFWTAIPDRHSGPPFWTAILDRHSGPLPFVDRAWRVDSPM